MVPSWKVKHLAEQDSLQAWDDAKCLYAWETLSYTRCSYTSNTLSLEVSRERTRSFAIATVVTASAIKFINYRWSEALRYRIFHVKKNAQLWKCKRLIRYQDLCNNHVVSVSVSFFQQWRNDQWKGFYNSMFFFSSFLVLGLESCDFSITNYLWNIPVNYIINNSTWEAVFLYRDWGLTHN